MQSKLQKSNKNNFITLLNFIVDPAVIVDEKGHFLVVNDAFTDLTGLSKNELIGTAFLNVKILTAESKATLLKNFKKRMQGLAVEPYEVSFTDKACKVRCVEVKAKKIDYAGHPADLVIFRDITRRKENATRLKEYSEEMEALVDDKVREIKESAEKLRSIFDSSPDAIIVTDLNGRIIECNQAGLDMEGFPSKDTLIGTSAFELVSPKDQQKAMQIMENLLKNKPIKNMEITTLTKNGREFPVEFSASVFQDGLGNPVGYAAVMTDITKRKKWRKRLNKNAICLKASRKILVLAL